MNPDTNPAEMVDHLFRHEAGKMVSVLTRIFGLKHIEIAEDIVQDTFLKALQLWGFNSIPPNPQAWLYKTAKNRTIDIIRHQKHVEEFASQSGYNSVSEKTFGDNISNLFLDNEIADSQLRMIFAACHPELPAESQIALTLKTLCGFGIKEIARSLLTTEANVNKRLYRAKQKLKESNLKFEIPTGFALIPWIESVYKVIYLLFNEGYNSAESETLIRKDLCSEAIRLCDLLSAHKVGDNPKTFALLALMCFHASRLDTRIDDKGCIILLKEQDRTKWNKMLIAKGFEFLERSSAGNELSEYHLEAGISAQHASSPSFAETDWKNVLQLYDLMMGINPSPVTMMNRAIVIGQISGPEAAIEELGKIKELDTYYLYHTTLAEFHSQCLESTAALIHLKKAKELTNSAAEINLIDEKISRLNSN